MEEAILDIKNSLKVLEVNQKDISTRLECIENNKSESDNCNDVLNTDEELGCHQRRSLQHQLSHSGGAALPYATGNNGPSSSYSGTAGNKSHATVARDGQCDPLNVQDEYQCIKDKVSSVKIPPELRVGTSKSGIKRDDQVTANVIANSAKYVETTIKLLWNLDEEPSTDDLVELFNVQKAHIDYLRQEHSALVVSGQFGSKTSQLFKNLSRGTTNLDNKQLDSLLKAVQITSNDPGVRERSSREYNRGRYNGSNYSGGYRYFGGARGRGYSNNNNHYSRNQSLSANNYSWNKEGSNNNNSHD